MADNPPFGAVITRYLKESIQTGKAVRQEKEKALQKEGRDIPFPGWEALDKEKAQQEPALWLSISDGQGNVVRKLRAPVTKGFHRIAWDLRYPSYAPLTEASKKDDASGMLVVPGEYQVVLSKEIDGVVTELDGPVSFRVLPLRKGSLEGSPYDETVAFWKEVHSLQAQVSLLTVKIREASKRTMLMRMSLERSPIEAGEFEKEIHDLNQRILEMESLLTGSSSRNEIGEKNPHTISMRIQAAMMGTSMSAYGPTPTHRRSMEIAREGFAELEDRFMRIEKDVIPELLKKLEGAGAPAVAD